MKKVVALLASFLVAASAAALPVSALDLTVYENAEFEYLDGWLRRVRTYPFYGVLVETDGSELTETMLDSFDGYTALTDLESFTSEQSWGVELVDFTTESKAYMIYTSSGMTTDELTAFGRNVMQELACIEAVHLVTTTMYQISFLDNAYYINPVDPDAVLDETVIPELEGYTIQRCDDITYHCTVPETLVEEFDAKNVPLIERYVYYKEFAASLMEKYPDIIDTAAPQFWCWEDEGETEASASSVWTNAGDPNTDGEVNAADAAEMLVSAAQIGTGVDVAVTSAADVNADGLLNAEDAAAVLSYAAAKGTGADVSWVDILRK